MEKVKHSPNTNLYFSKHIHFKSSYKIYSDYDEGIKQLLYIENNILYLINWMNDKIKIIQIYQKVYLLHLVSEIKRQKIFITEIGNNETKSNCLILPNLNNNFSISVIDNLLLIHNIDYCQSIVYDFAYLGKKRGIITKSLTFEHSKNLKNTKKKDYKWVSSLSKNNRGSEKELEQKQEQKQGREQQQLPDYSVSWNCILPNLIFLPKIGFLGKIKINFKSFANYFKNKNSMFKFFFRRNNCKKIILSQLFNELKNETNLLTISKYFHFINRYYSISHQKIYHLEDQFPSSSDFLSDKPNGKKSSNEANTPREQSLRRRKTISTFQNMNKHQKYSSTDNILFLSKQRSFHNSDTYKSIQKGGKGNKKRKKKQLTLSGFDIINRDEVKQSPLSTTSLLVSSTTKNQRKKKGRKVKKNTKDKKNNYNNILNYNNKNKIILNNIPFAIINQSDFYKYVFLPLHQQNVSINYFFSIIIEYIRSLKFYQLKISYPILKFIVQILLIEKKFEKLTQFIQSQVIGDSKRIALYLIEIDTAYEPLLLLSCKILYQMGSHEKLINALFEKNKLDLILQIIPLNKLNKKFIIPLLDISWGRNNFTQYVNLFEYFQNDIPENLSPKYMQNYNKIQLKYK
ncbi:colon cancer-associated protein mic1 [Anaeramoeba flamelloides]|uniref:Colon cancer-associated protein mic1 n=1 Tax=Anaeramoeba flamelloides TaxID=1746091 RepID=A0AAV8A2Y6_9EUKA|nr:colon cancer-associated protein mic1 [Anaeramoeba flamelloides]